MTRTHESQSLKAQQRDRHVARNGFWKNRPELKKGGAGGSNWGTIGSEAQELEPFEYNEEIETQPEETSIGVPETVKALHGDVPRVQVIEPEVFNKIKKQVSGEEEYEEFGEDEGEGQVQGTANAAEENLNE
ncbi:hypothetical protein BKA69DRAFT_1123251 [Paraphysoderma sedebokerense]|nr:hypothetical protein BKA69DRAFT_1123251 [Paraphysoderma sedebokerense]